MFFQGTAFFEQCIQFLEEQYKFKLEDYLHPSCNSSKSKGYLTLALISTQKLLLFLGDLSRYKEQANDSTIYGFARQYVFLVQLLIYEFELCLSMFL